MCCDIQRHKLDAKQLKCGNSPKKVTPQPGAQKRASSEGPTHQKKLLPNHLLKKVVLKGQLTKKATSQPATKKRAKYKGPTHKKSFFTTIYLKKQF